MYVRKIIQVLNLLLWCVRDDRYIREEKKQGNQKGVNSHNHVKALTGIPVKDA